MQLRSSLSSFPGAELTRGAIAPQIEVFLMPAVGSITLNDGQATPVAHTFIPLGPTRDGVWWFEDQSAASALGYAKLAVQLVRPGPPSPRSVSNQDRVSRLKWAFHLPGLETLGTADNGLTPPPSVAYIGRSQGEFILPERMPAQGRKDLRAYSSGLMAHSGLFLPLIELLQGYY